MVPSFLFSGCSLGAWNIYIKSKLLFCSDECSTLRSFAAAADDDDDIQLMFPSSSLFSLVSFISVLLIHFITFINIIISNT